MKRYVLMSVGVLLMLLVVLGLVSKQMGLEETKAGKEAMPNLYLSNLDSTQVELYDIEFEKGLIISFINSECEICHAQVDELYKRAYKLPGYEIILVSYQDIEDIKELSGDYTDPPFSFWKVDYQLLNDQFNDVRTPQTRLYNTDKEMIKSIDGIARVAHIKKHFELLGSEKANR